VETDEKTIVVVRHAKSDWTTDEADFDRPLAPRGRRDARALGEILAEYDIDLLWCSPARRTMETWEQACLSGAAASRMDTRSTFYDTWSTALLNEMTTLDDSITTLAIINHQPTVGNLVVSLAQPSPLAERAGTVFPTASIAVLTHPGPWEAILQGDCVLTRFESPRG